MPVATPAGVHVKRLSQVVAARLEPLYVRADIVTVAAASHEVSSCDATSGESLTPISMTIEDQLVRLSEQAHAYRARAVRLDARLRRFEHRGADVAVLRERLHASAANVDHAVAALCAAVSKVA